MIKDYSIVILKKEVLGHSWNPDDRDRIYPAGSKGTVLETPRIGVCLVEFPGDIDEDGFVSTYYNAEVPESDLVPIWNEETEMSTM